MYKLMNKVTAILAALTIIGFVAPKSSYAYIDPGSGSYILQLLLAALFAMSFTFKLWWAKVSSFFLKIFKGKKDQNDTKK